MWQRILRISALGTLYMEPHGPGKGVAGYVCLSCLRAVLRRGGPGAASGRPDIPHGLRS